MANNDVLGKKTIKNLHEHFAGQEDKINWRKSGMMEELTLLVAVNVDNFVHVDGHGKVPVHTATTKRCMPLLNHQCALLF